MSKSIAIIGASGHGKVAAEIAELQKWHTIHFYDDNPKDHYPWPIIGTVDNLITKISDYSAIFIAVGNNEIRQQLFLKFQQFNCLFLSLIHPSAIISPSAQIHLGCLVAAGSIINADVVIQQGCIINTKASIDHDCMIDEFTHIAPGTTIAGNVTIGKNCWIGIGSTIIQNINITHDIYIGAGSLVIRNLTLSGLYYGHPAQLHKKKNLC